MRLHSTLSPSSREASRTAKSIAYIRMPDCDFIDQAIASHGEWKRHLQKVIATGESDTPVEVIARDDRCAFGAWLCGPSLSAMDKASIYYETIRVLHAEFHSAAALVLQLALDGNKKPCRVLASNAGHCLYSGIAHNNRARSVARALTGDWMFSGWGIRTLSSREARYNPISYHNGSVWPHDNAIIAAGFLKYGLKHEFTDVFTALFEASVYMQFQRLPELFCGFHRRRGQAPTLYPVACTPQTWASGALLMMLKSALGLEFEPAEKRIILRNPVLPPFLQWVTLKKLPLTDGKSVDLNIKSYGEGVTIEVARKPVDVSITVYK